MFHTNKVLWKEGMFLQPQHFQLFERLQTAHLNARIGSLVYSGYQYGFTELEIDRDALLGGNFTVSRASGVFPDGSCFSLGGGSAGDSAEALTRSFVSYCRPDQLTLDVYLALPIAGEDRSPLLEAGERLDGDGHIYKERRYTEKNISISDELSHERRKEIAVGFPNYLIRFEGEPLDGCVWLRVARLSRTGSGYMELSRSSAPPVLFARVSDVLRNCVSGALELLWARIGSLMQSRRQTEYGQAFFAASQENSYRLFNTLCMFTPLLSRLHEQPKIHPFDYYKQLSMLCGSLQSFSPAVTLEKIPAYDHSNPAAAFITLADTIREALKVEFWTDCTALPLEQINASTWHCRFPDERFAVAANLFIGVSAKIAQKELLVDVLQRMKAGSRDKLDYLISSSLQGLTLIHVKNIPEGLAAKPEYVYFVVDKHGPLWEGVEATGTLGIHFSGGGYPEMKLEVLALKHQE